VVLTYHKIGRQFELGITTVSRRRFASHLDYLKKSAGKMAAASGVVASGGPALTFDDGYESVYREAYPEMAERGMVGTVFPVVGAVGGLNRWDVRLSPRPFRHLSWSQLRELAEAGFEIGSHTLSHRALTSLDGGDLREELSASKKKIEDRTGSPVVSIAYPFGLCSEKVVEHAVAAGYRFGFLSMPAPGDDPMRTGRMGVYYLDGDRSLGRKLGWVRGHRLECAKTRFIAGLSRGTTLVKR
jgi:peptidoglycan/xylan/chitin deacetylase (PgdA/CDA1 family)